MTETYAGIVALVGRPNVGKSTLMNHLIGEKISITSRRPQTTRHQVMGVLTEGARQVIFVDTPGMHQNQEKAINRYMNKAAESAVRDVDVILFMVDSLAWTPDDEAVLDKLKKVNRPIWLVINKIDKVKDKTELLPHIESLTSKFEFAKILPVSALHGHNRDELAEEITGAMPEGPFWFPEDQLTDRSERFLSAEIVREKIMRQLGDEVPYSVAVEIERFAVENDILHIHALILVERDGQKRIVIGDKGSRIKLIGSEARKDMERLFGHKVMLNLWVKTKRGWSDDERALRSLGYDAD
ncbi:GTPase Era [Salinibius halmophilus]|uniref:GTPase Era n=1 Tax=Salinibius halmophilus TaxID=1853216 RepID=UPI000E660A3A|nr:GTPase Era [Salinibius halmophilus]